MKRKRIFQALAIASLLTGAGCTNLDENLKDTWTDKNFLKTDEERAAAILAPYGTLFSYGGHNGYFTLQELTTDEMMIPQRGGDWYDGGQPVGLHVHNYAATFDAMGTWNNIYGGVSACNRLLADAGIASSKASVAELRTLRAYFYWNLLDLYGNVPVVTKLGESQKQSTRAAVYAFIESEITGAMDDLPKKSDASTYGRLTYYAAQAILAKLYLNAQVYTGTPQWQKAIDASNVIINSGVFNLEKNYSDVFVKDNNTSKEIIFQVPFDHLYGQGFNLGQMTLHYSSQLTYKLQEQPWNGYCSLEEFYNSYDPADKRRANNFLAGVQYNSDGVTPITDASYEKISPNPNDPDAVADPDGEVVTFTPHVNELFPNALRQAGVRDGKYVFVQGNTSNLDNDFPLYRYGDILLTKAEALFRLNGYADATALGLVNQVHQRTGLADFVTMTEAEFLAERGREMFSESWRRNDLIRFGQYGRVWFGKAAPDADKHWELFPIPVSQILATAGTETSLVQNPGYN